ncbi:hypothetical protein [uncultured Muribaculum sp.]|uniref:hypothetical protein n=1 Tax=uncultured Muribaculum sp. TaxID=1918613 RepID=UPI00273197EB|nr:hypothetical protein [uncultured Muribaculum sp.]
MKRLFNVYYVNYAKVYEIKMMLNNRVAVGQSIEKGKEGEAGINIEASSALDFLKLFKGEAQIGAEAKGGISSKIIETLEVKTTKSIILNEVFDKCNEIKSFSSKVEEGSLVLINNVSLSLINDFELRTVKLFNSGAFKNLPIPNTEGFDLTNLFNSMFKDYAYKIKGSLSSSLDKILIKIPVSFDNEFESSYSVDDLFIGKVSILGIYKGVVPLKRLKNTFEYFSELGSIQNGLAQVDESEDVQDSQYPKNEDKTKHSYWGSNDSTSYHYIDLLAIVQNIRTNE